MCSKYTLIPSGNFKDLSVFFSFGILDVLTELVFEYLLRSTFLFWSKLSLLTFELILVSLFLLLLFLLSVFEALEPFLVELKLSGIESGSLCVILSIDF